MNVNFKIFAQLGAAFFLALLAAFIIAEARAFVARFHHGAPAAAAAPKSDVEVDEEDPSFISGLSRVYQYAPGAGGSDVESDDDAAIIPAITGPVTAQEYLVEDIRTGAILNEKDIDRVVPVASLTKLATAEVSRQLMSASTTITITDAILAAYGTNGHLRTGERISAGDLLYPLFLVSSNDAAEALAQGYEDGTGRADFIRAMNDWVHSIGAYHTNFYDPSGLSPLTVSTARDVATITKWIHDNDPSLLAITDLRSASVGLHTWTNSTHFLNLADYVGGKDGYIPEAGETASSLFSAAMPVAAVAAATDTPARYLIVVLGSQDRDNDVLSLLEKAEGK